MKIRALGAELFHGGQTDGRTDMTKLIVAFRNFANAPQNITHVPKCSIKYSDIHYSYNQ